MIKIGNAPVSYGAFEVTVGKHEGVPSATDVLDAVQAAGYAGIDLGPLGYLGLGADLKHALDSRGLALAGGYVEIDVAAPAAGFAELSAVCDQFDAVGGQCWPGGTTPRNPPQRWPGGTTPRNPPQRWPGGTTPRNPPQRWPGGTTPRNPPQRWPGGTLCQSGDTPEPPMARNPPEPLFRPRPTVALIGQGGPTEKVVGEVVDVCAARGYQAVLHNEVGTQISGPDSVVWVLENTQAALCLDTGHLVAAGGDPFEILANWRDRVTHVHLKDSRSAGPFTSAMELWENDVFCRLGEGVGRVGEVLDELRVGGYAGWIVVEHDVLPTSPARAVADQVANREYLRERGV